MNWLGGCENDVYLGTFEEREIYWCPGQETWIAWEGPEDGDYSSFPESVTHDPLSVATDTGWRRASWEEIYPWLAEARRRLAVV